MPASERCADLFTKVLGNCRTEDLALLCSRPRNPYLIPHLALPGNNLAWIVGRFGRNANMPLAEIKVLFDPGFKVADQGCICRPRGWGLLGGGARPAHN
jgi:hypothetical protein